MDTTTQCLRDLKGEKFLPLCLRCSKNLRKFSSTKREFLNTYKLKFHLKCWIENKKDKYLLSLLRGID